jgi:hypothetical protein
LTATVYAKSTLGPGARQVFVLDDYKPVPQGLPLAARATEVSRQTENGVALDHPLADVLGIDTRTFTRGAYWDGSFADRSLSSLVAGIRARPAARTVPIIAVGEGLPDTFTLYVTNDERSAVSLPVHVVARARAFPGYQLTSQRPLVVVDRAILLHHDDHGVSQVWFNGGDAHADRVFRRAGVPVALTIRRDDRLLGDLRPQLWAVDYVRFVGLVVAAVPLAGLGLYFAVGAARRRLGTALARRMGVRHRTVAAGTASEVVAMLGAGLAFGVVGAWVAIVIVHSRLDPEPQQPPAALLRLDGATAGWCAVSVVLIAIFATLVVDRRSARASLPEALRHAP